MANPIRNVLTLFLASPGDVAEERAVTREVVEELNDVVGRELNWHIDLLGWEDTLPGYARPQELINKDVDACELFIGILWRRWGQPTGKFSSGFEEEFKRARERRQSTAVPEMWLSFKQVEPELLRDPGEQLRRVVEFRQDQIRSREVLFKEFSSTDDWRKKLHRWLLQYVLQKARGSSETLLTTVDKVSPTPDLISVQPPPERVTEQPAQKQLEELLGVINHFIAASGVELSTDGSQSPDLFSLARLQLLAKALLSPQYTHEVLSNHEINLLYRLRERLEATGPERWLILRTLVGDQHNLVQGWYWFKDVDVLTTTSALFALAAEDGDLNIRRRAVEMLKRAEIDPDVEKELIDDLLSDKEAGIRLVVLSYLGAVGTQAHLSKVGRCFEDESRFVRDAAAVAELNILIRTDPERAFRELLSTSAQFDKQQVLAELRKTSAAVAHEDLITALRSAEASVRTFATEELAVRQLLTIDLATPLLEDSSKEVKETAYLELIKRGVEVEPERLLKSLPEQRQVWSHAFAATGLSYPKHPGEVILALYRTWSVDRLLAELRFHSAEAPMIYKALSLFHFQSMANDIRTNLEDDFETLRAQSIQGVRDRLGSLADDFLSTLTDLNDFMKNGLIAAALAGVAINGSPDDLRFGRKYLQHTEDSVRIEAVRIIDRFGNAGDVESLIELTKNGGNLLKRLAASVALKHASDVNGVAQVLLQSNDLAVFGLAVRSLWKSEAGEAGALLELFLKDGDENKRGVILTYLADKYTGEDLELLLKRYVDQTIYYYNIVCWLDRLLYAPVPYRNAFRHDLTAKHGEPTVTG